MGVMDDGGTGEFAPEQTLAEWLRERDDVDEASDDEYAERDGHYMTVIRFAAPPPSDQ